MALQVRRIPLDRLLLESDSPDGSLVLSEAWLEGVPGCRELVGGLEQYRTRNEPGVVRCACVGP